MPIARRSDSTGFMSPSCSPGFEAATSAVRGDFSNGVACEGVASAVFNERWSLLPPSRKKGQSRQGGLSGRRAPHDVVPAHGFVQTAVIALVAAGEPELWPPVNQGEMNGATGERIARQFSLGRVMQISE